MLKIFKRFRNFFKNMIQKQKNEQFSSKMPASHKKKQKLWKNEYSAKIAN